MAADKDCPKRLVRDLAAYIANHDQSNLPHGLLLRADEFLGEDLWWRCADRDFEDRHGRHCVAVLPDEPEEWCESCRVVHALMEQSRIAAQDSPDAH